MKRREHARRTDPSCLIALDRIGQLDLLPALFTVLAPPAVVAEFGWQPDWLTVGSAPDVGRVAELIEVIDRGEAEAIAPALTIPDAELHIDEARGRRVAERLGLQVTGTAGILLDALIRDHGFRLSEQLYQHILEAAEEI